MPEQSGQVRFELSYKVKKQGPSILVMHTEGGSVHESDKPDLIKMMGAITIIIVLHNIVYYTQKGCLKRHPAVYHVQINSDTSGHVPVN